MKVMMGWDVSQYLTTYFWWSKNNIVDYQSIGNCVCGGVLATTIPPPIYVSSVSINLRGKLRVQIAGQWSNRSSGPRREKSGRLPRVGT